MAKNDQKHDGPIEKDLFDILACPECKGDLAYKNDHKSLFCAKCHFTYPIEDGVPILLTPEDRKRLNVH